MSLFNVMSPLNGGGLDTYKYPVEYPFDFNAGLDYTRPATGISPMPYPLTTGYVDGFVPLFDNMEYLLMRGRNAYGPFVGQIQIPLQQIFPNQMGGLSKVKG